MNVKSRVFKGKTGKSKGKWVVLCQIEAGIAFLIKPGTTLYPIFDYEMLKELWSKLRLLKTNYSTN